MAIGTLGAALIGAAGSLGAGLIGKSGADKAAAAQEQAARYAADMQMQQYQQNRSDMEPWRAAGGDAINMLRRLMTGDNPDREMVGRYMANDPIVQNRLAVGLKYGQQALDRSAASRGMLFSGAQAKALNDYAQDKASEEYGNWYNRMAGVAGAGQTAANSTGAFGAQAAAGAGNAMMTGAAGAGASRASGYNALASGIGSGINNAMFYNFLARPQTAYASSAYAGGNAGK